MDKEAKISVVTPCYNEVDRMGIYFEKLLNQTILPYEIIVVDGGSKDGTIEIIRHFQKRFSMIKLLKGSHQGPARDRNIGWKAAKGTHILFLDADSQVDKNFIEVVKKSVEGEKTEKKIVLHHSVVSSWSEIINKYMWYGRTMPKYWRRNIGDFGTLARMLISLGAVIFPFLWFFEITFYLFLVTFFLIFLLALKISIQTTQKAGNFRYFFPTILFVFVSFIATGVGIVSIPFLKLFGKYTVGR